MSEQKKQGPKGVTCKSLDIEITLLDPKLEPQFRPLIEKVSEVVREITGSACSEEVAAKLRW